MYGSAKSLGIVYHCFTGTFVVYLICFCRIDLFLIVFYFYKLFIFIFKLNNLIIYFYSLAVNSAH